MPKRREDKPAVGRRNFLKGAGLVGAAALTPAAAQAQAVAPKANLKAAPPGPLQLAADTQPPTRESVTQASSGGDFMVDVFKSLDIDYLAMNCASSFRGLHEAVINYAKNSKPEILTCPHEEIAVHMGQGYAKMEGKPLAMICHGVVGLQHATMAMYNAWCDRVPVIVFGGNIVEADKRAPGAEWVHSAIDPGAIVRDFVKWDDQPASLQHFAESMVRAYKIATTPPMGPVFISLDAELQENPIRDAETLRIPKVARVIPPQADSGAIKELAKMLVAAENPVLLCDRLARTPAGMARLTELAETLQCAVVDNAGRMNFPSRHPLNQTGRRGAVISQADVVLAIEVNELWGSLNNFNDRIVRTSRPITKKDAKIITLGTRDLYLKSNYQDFGRHQDVDMAIAGDGEASLPALIEEVKRLVDGGRKSAFEARGKRFAAARLAMIEQAKVGRDHGLGCQPDHDRAHVRGSVGPDQGRGLVAGRQRHPHHLAAPAVELRQALPVERRLGRCRHRLQRAGLARCGARQQATWPPHAQLQRRRRSHVRARRRCGRRRTTRSRCSISCTTTAPIIRRSCTCRRWPTAAAAASTIHHRHHHHQSEHRLRHGGARLRRPRRGADHRSEGSRRPRSSARSRWSSAASPR